MDMDAEKALLNEALHLGVKGWLLQLSGSHSRLRFTFDHRAQFPQTRKHHTENTIERQTSYATEH
jgi:hypothetical protein